MTLSPTATSGKAAYQVTPPAPGPTPPKKPHGCLSAFLGFMLVLSLMATLLIVNLRITVLSPNFWKTWLDKSETYERVEEILIPSIFTGFTEGGSMSLTGAPKSGEIDEVTGLPLDTEIPAGFENFEEYDSTGDYSAEFDTSTEMSLSPEVMESLAELVQESISPEWMQEQSELAIDAFFRWVHGEDEDLMIVFDLTPLQGPFSTGLIDVIEEEYNNLPPCSTDFTPEEIQNMEGMHCRYEGIDFEQVKDEFAKQNPEDVGFGNIPNEYVIDEAVFKNFVEPQNKDLPSTAAPTSPWYSNPPDFYKVFTVLLWVSVILTVLFAGLIILIHRRNVSRMLKVLGTTLLVPSALVLILDLIMYFGSGALTLQMATFQSPVTDTASMSGPSFGAESQILNDFVAPLLSEFVKASLFHIIIITAIIMVGSIIMLILSRVLKNRQPVGYYNQPPLDTVGPPSPPSQPGTPPQT